MTGNVEAYRCCGKTVEGEEFGLSLTTTDSHEASMILTVACLYGHERVVAKFAPQASRDTRYMCAASTNGHWTLSELISNMFKPADHNLVRIAKILHAHGQPTTTKVLRHALKTGSSRLIRYAMSIEHSAYTRR